MTDVHDDGNATVIERPSPVDEPVESATTSSIAELSPVSPRTGRVVLAVAFVVAGLPYVLAFVHAWRQRWIPSGDNARIVADALAVKSTAPPLLGLASDSLANVTGIVPVRHPGPMEAWILGGVHLIVPGVVGILFGVLLIQLASVLLSLLAARRLWGIGGVAVTAMCLSVVGSALGTQVLATTWNPHLPVVPGIAIVLCAWAWFLGDWAPGLPAAVVLACLGVQTHFTELAVVAIAVAPLVGLLLVRRWMPFDVPTPPHGRRLVVGSIAAGILAWVPPLYFELTGPYSNVTNLARAATDRGDDARLGAGYGVTTISRILAGPPPWGPRPVLRPLWGLPTTLDSRAIGLLLVVVLVVVLGALALRARDAVVVGTSLSSLSSIAGGVYLLSVSTFALGAAVYQSRWAWSIFVTLWSGMICGFGRLLLPSWFGAPVPPEAPSAASSATGSRRRRGWTVSPRVALVVGLLLLTGALIRVVAPGGPTDRINPDVAIESMLVRELASGVRREIPGSTKLTVQIPSATGRYGSPALDLFTMLQLDGYDVKFTTRRERPEELLGRGNLDRGDDPARVQLRVVPRDGADPAQVVASVPLLDANERAEHSALKARLTRQIADGDLAWTGPGAFLHFGKQPDPEFLLTGTRLVQSLVAGTVTGDAPSIDDAYRYAQLQVRTEAASQLMLERVPSSS